MQTQSGGVGIVIHLIVPGHGKSRGGGSIGVRSSDSAWGEMEKW